MAKSKSKSNLHVHKYLRHTFKSGYVVYKCMLPGCSHYIDAALVAGKQTICWRCGAVCLIPIRDVDNQLKRPHCLSCTKVYNRVRTDKTIEVDTTKLADMSLEDLLGGKGE
jgi:hypothetical protein